MNAMNDAKLVDILELLPELEILYIMLDEGVTNRFLNVWFKSGDDDGDYDGAASSVVKVGHRHKYKPLLVYCHGTKIVSKPAHDKEQFTWTLSFEEENLDPEDKCSACSC